MAIKRREKRDPFTCIKVILIYTYIYIELTREVLRTPSRNEVRHHQHAAMFISIYTSVCLHMENWRGGGIRTET